MKYYQLLLFLFSCTFTFAQDDLLNEIETETIDSITFEQPAFKAMKIGNLQSTKVGGKGDFYMYISHRFGSLKDGWETFFGLDNANTKIQLVYALFDGFQIGISRESWRKTYAGSTKIRIKEQKDNFPINISAYGTFNVNTQVSTELYPEITGSDRMSYAAQFLFSKRIKKLSLELAPTYVRQNLVYNVNQDHNQYVLGIGGRYKVSKRMSVNIDYSYNFSRASDSDFKDPLTVGLDIETGGHVFQLLFTNAQSTNEPGFMSYAEGDWSTGDIFFGFNIVRVF
ncbi:DUF5777 family beta-barrel protein [Flammeovirga kamogawensis]|uniref:DUF5777 domain-containing protein n=1 Tax=Flammeovirga kamogawensis TaxID=373891 RepID=A0ABX8H185_9BACT|nr:DUF5777 family beta-barrel protein [Flammeovirga kamogawensis]MBB6462596.1 putative porin [Flammeovirga kamogawensis]QWG09658.1 hypothetical protein KM029_23940 [Flammeovirga kamogawensis]TRX65172.1 hypothetical protein EO216_21840 [Flammeovirga kamogawensis]